MRLVNLPKMHLAFCYDVGENAKKNTYEKLDQFLVDKGLNPSLIPHYFYCLNMNKQNEKKIVYVLYALVNDALNASGEISTMAIHAGSYIVFEMEEAQMKLFTEGNDTEFEILVKKGLNVYKKTRVMDQLFALIEETAENEQFVYHCHIPVK